MNAPTPFSLSGQTALITGGGSGLGLATAKCLAACGARVILAGRREAELTAAVAEIGDLATAQVLDVTDLASLPAMAEKLANTHGPIGILINNAGINLKKPYAETNDEELLRILQTNVIGWTIAWLCSPAARFVTGAIIPVDGGVSVGF